MTCARLLQAALALGLAAPCAHGQALSPEFQRRFGAGLWSLMGQLRSTSEHAAYLRRKPVKLAVLPPSFYVQPNSFAAYNLETHTVYFNAAILEHGALELVSRGVGEEELPLLLAWKSLSVMAHEVRHAMLKARARSKGFDYGVNLLEEEMVCFFDEMSVLQEALAVKPEFWSRDRLLEIDATSGKLLIQWQKNPSAVREFVAPLYPAAFSVLSTSRGELLEEIDATDREAAEVIVQSERIRRESPPGDPALFELERDQPDRFSAARIARNKLFKKSLSDARYYKAFKGFLKAEIQAMLAKARAQRR